VKVDLHATPAQAAAQLLPEFTRRFYEAGREAFAQGDAETLHEFRIAAKKFRYALELFQPLYGPRFAEKLARLKKLQDFLGRLNDLATARIILEGREPGEFRAWLAAEETDLRAKLTAFWDETVAAPGVEEGWIRYLTRYAGRAKKKGP
jgi:CHAD domain-containing protein